MDNNNEMNLSEATEALCTAESAVESMDEMIKLFGVNARIPLRISSANRSGSLPYSSLRRFTLRLKNWHIRY